MKITKSQIKQILLEEVESNDRLISAIHDLTSTMEDLDISIDYLAAAFTGEDPMSLGSAQKTMGRFATPTRKPSAPKDIDEAQLKQYVMEALDEVLGPDAETEDYIEDFEKSDAPQFKGKSKEKKRQMAIAAAMSAKRNLNDG